MRITTSLLAALATATGVAAQLPQDQNNEHGNLQTNTSYTTRSGVSGPSEGWIVNVMHADWMRGMCQIVDATSGQLVGRAAGMRYVLQDQSGVTQEPFGIGIFGDKSVIGGTAGEPTLPDINDALPAGAIGVAVTGLNTPASTNTGAVAWLFTSTFSTPFDAVPNGVDVAFGGTGQAYMGCKVPANQAWTADGVSFHAPFWGNAGATGDNPSSGAVNNGAIPDPVLSNDLTADPTGVNLNSPQTGRVHRVHILSPGTSLRVGADVDPTFQRGSANPNYGYGGLFPDQVARLDGLAFKVEDQNTVTSTLNNFGVVGSFPDPSGAVFGQVGIPLFQGTNLYAGELHTSLASLANFDWLFGLGAANTSGVAEFTIIPFGSLSAALGQISFQGIAFGVDSAGAPYIKASNAMRIDSQ